MDTSYSSSLQCNLSLQTLPSLPSLQTKLSPKHLNLAVHHHALDTLKPRGGAQITSLAVHHSLLYAAAGNEINVFDVNNLSLIDTFNDKDSSSGSIKSINFCKDRVFTAHQDSQIRIWKLTAEKKHRLIGNLPTLTDRLRRSIFPGNYVRVRRHKKRLWIKHHDAVSGLAVTDLGRICSVSWDKTLKIWDGNSGFRCLQSVTAAHDDAVNAVVVSPDGTAFTGSADKRIRVWRAGPDGPGHVLVATLEKHRSAVNALALTSDGAVLFSGSCDRSILVWEREDSANYMVLTGALRGHSGAILCLVYVSDFLLSGSADRTVRIWQRAHEEQYCCLAVLDGHKKPVKSLTAVTGNGEGSHAGGVKVFSGSFDGEIMVWQVVVSNLDSPT
ncbi:hypothetical protein NMG60_11030841 [Bertholletia excelsa]